MAETVIADGCEPMPLVRPGSIAELAEHVRTAGAVFPVGGRTHWHVGGPPQVNGRPSLAIEMTGLDQVIDYPARDMTITVQAGINVARLQQILAPENQALPIDVARPEQATVGGILAANVSGPRRLGYGTLRDYLLGFTAINDEGKEFKAGGRVVKNVAGYDLCKLMIGSLGTLGIITQATLKLKPLPEQTAGVILGCGGANSAPLEAILDRLHASPTRPVILDLLNRAAGRLLFQKAGLEAPDADWIILTAFEGNGEAVHWQVQQAVRDLGELGIQGSLLQARIGCTSTSLCRAVVEFPDLEEARLTLKANMRPSILPRFCQTVAALPPGPLLHAHAGSGIVVGHFLNDLTLAEATAILTSWRELAAGGDGSVVVRRAPAPWKTSAFVWGPARADTWLMRAVRDKFDPRGRFNPGRFLPL